MAETVIMPKLGFDMAEGTLVRWVIGEGQPVVKGAVLAEIETDKATVEVESNFNGIVARHLVSEKEVVPVNTPIAIITAPGEKLESVPVVETQNLASVQQAATRQGVETQNLASVQQAAARQVVETQNLASVQQAAARQVVETQNLASVQQAAARQGVETQNLASVQQAAAKQVVETQNLASVMGGPAVKASPIAKRLAHEKGLDLAAIPGSGPGGRIVKKDVEAAALAPVSVPATAPVVMPVASQATFAAQPETTVPLSRLRAAIARRMAEAKQQVPHFYITHEYDMAALMALRKQINALLPEAEKVSVNDLIVKAVALTLRSFPNLNASFQGSQVVQHGAIHIGIAVAVEGGLLTIVCKNTDQKPVRQIATEVKALVGRARNGKVRLDDIEGSTFSVSNLGMFDVEVFSAIINPPEAAILAIGSVKDVPVVVDGQLSVGTRMKATISVDHRVSDGVEAARFMQALADPLENPLKLLL